MTRAAPGPPGLPGLGHLIHFRRDVLGLLASSRARYGDVVRFRLGPLVFHLVAHPELVREVLVERTDLFDKETRSSKKIRALTGLSLLTANGGEWQRRRRLMQPAFRPAAMAGFVARIHAAVDERMADWREHAAAGRPWDVTSEMARLTFTAVGRTLFSSEVGGDAARVEAALAVLLGQIYRRFERLIDPPAWWPWAGGRRFEKALGDVDAIVRRILAGRNGPAGSREPGDGAARDLLDLMLGEGGGEEGGGFSHEELRNETVTLLLAGHETTANALAFAAWLLAANPEAQEAVHGEIHAALGERAPTYAELAALPQTERALREALRLYPPIWGIERRAAAACELGGHPIPAGSSVIVSPWVTHRHGDFWDEPERFDPARFAPERAAGRPALAYLPFGAGPRFCIGGHFALIEALLILVLLVRAFRLRLVPGPPLRARAGITLRPAGAVRLLLEAR